MAGLTAGPARAYFHSMTGQDQAPVFAATLSPQRSLDRRGLRIATCVLAASGAGVALLVLLLGAWLVVGFVTGAILLAIGLFLLHHRLGRTVEEVVLDGRALTVTRRRGGRAVTRWEFQPGWLRVSVADDDRGRPAGVLLASHGRRLAVGQFLTREEQTAFAAALRAALAAWRAPHAMPC